MTFVNVSHKTARVEVQDVIAAVRPTTCLVSIMLANNETGVIMVGDCVRMPTQGLTTTASVHVDLWTGPTCNSSHLIY